MLASMASEAHAHRQLFCDFCPKGLLVHEQSFPSSLPSILNSLLSQIPSMQDSNSLTVLPPNLVHADKQHIALVPCNMILCRCHAMLRHKVVE